MCTRFYNSITVKCENICENVKKRCKYKNRFLNFVIVIGNRGWKLGENDRDVLATNHDVCPLLVCRRLERWPAIKLLSLSESFSFRVRRSGEACREESIIGKVGGNGALPLKP